MINRTKTSLLLAAGVLFLTGPARAQGLVAEGAKRAGLFTALTLTGAAIQIARDGYAAAGLSKNLLSKPSAARKLGAAARAPFSPRAWSEKLQGLRNIVKPEVTRSAPGAPALVVPPLQVRLWDGTKANPMIVTGLILGSMLACNPNLHTDVYTWLKELLTSKAVTPRRDSDASESGDDVPPPGTGSGAGMDTAPDARVQDLIAQKHALIIARQTAGRAQSNQLAVQIRDINKELMRLAPGLGLTETSDLKTERPKSTKGLPPVNPIALTGLPAGTGAVNLSADAPQTETRNRRASVSSIHETGADVPPAGNPEGATSATNNQFPGTPEVPMVAPGTLEAGAVPGNAQPQEPALDAQVTVIAPGVIEARNGDDNTNPEQ